MFYKHEPFFTLHGHTLICYNFICKKIRIYVKWKYLNKIFIKINNSLKIRLTYPRIIALEEKENVWAMLIAREKLYAFISDLFNVFIINLGLNCM